MAPGAVGKPAALYNDLALCALASGLSATTKKL